MCFLLLLTVIGTSQSAYHRSLKVMGSWFDLTIIARNEIEGNHYIDLATEEIIRIEHMISSSDSDSQTYAINKNAGIIPVRVDRELFYLIERAIKLSKLTQGAFDISYASMGEIWKFDGSMKKISLEADISKSMGKIGYQNIILNSQELTIFLQLPGMKIGFGAIGKGYAADKAKLLLLEQGVEAGIINASGDLSAWGKQPDGSDWLVAITNPSNQGKAFAWLPVRNEAAVTSGNNDKLWNINGKRFPRIIDPKMGYPSKGTFSTTVFTVNAELADALSTSIYIMGVETGLDFVNQLKGVECIIVDDENRMHISDNIILDKLNK